MKAMLSRIGLWPVYLLLLASLGPLFILSINMNRIMVETVVTGILILFAVLVGLRLILALVFRRPSVSDPILALVVLAGFYNNFFARDDNALIFWIWIAVFLLPIPFVLGSVRVRRSLPKFLCVFLVVLNGLIVFNIIGHDVWDDRPHLRVMLDDHFAPIPPRDSIHSSDRPDIYFLVFDRYARADQLAAVYDFDNTSFTAALRERGFQVSDNAYSAYQRTAHSLASTLNFDYLPVAEGIVSNDWVPLYEALRAPRLYDALAAEGYTIVNMGSWWEPTRTSPTADRNVSYLAVPETLRPMVEGSAIMRGLGRLGLTVLDPRERQCARIKHKFDTIDELASAAEPVFVFAHFLVPHPPYVIDADGVCKSADEAIAMSRRDNYIAQLEYTNAAVLRLVDTLIESNPQSVIILQADEGPWPQAYAGDEISRFGGDVTPVDWSTVSADDLKEKMAILNAIYLPDRPDVAIGDGFAPVNTFRMILREYFDHDLPDLDVRTSVFPSDASLWEYRDVRDELGR